MGARAEQEVAQDLLGVLQQPRQQHQEKHFSPLKYIRNLTCNAAETVPRFSHRKKQCKYHA